MPLDRFVALPDISGLPLGLVAEEDYQEAKMPITEIGSISLVGTNGLW